MLSYDNSIQMFPSNIVSGTFGFEEKPYFEAEEQSREAEAVQVDFGTSAD